jgi:hypothetical protein
MKVKCSECHKELEVIERPHFKIPHEKLYFIPNHRFAWPMTPSRNKYSLCNRSLMLATPTEFINVD